MKSIDTMYFQSRLIYSPSVLDIISSAHVSIFINIYIHICEEAVTVCMCVCATRRFVLIYEKKILGDPRSFFTVST